ncbi:MAG TPA: hypothetical protein VNF05_03810 [Acidimicrobiales bacterium]|nr:hypothetical protein [Acidimicrobiales bacterium]
MTTSISANDGDEPKTVDVSPTYGGTDKHAFNKKVPNVDLSIVEVDAPEDEGVSVVLNCRDTRILGEALIPLSGEADEWKYKFEPNEGNGLK